ncbi:hypothetical protein D3C75_1151340 [compost metagenome]
MWDTIAGALTTAVILAPQQVDSGMCHHVQHAFLVCSQGGVVIAAWHVGEHAGHGDSRFGTAGTGIFEINHIVLLQAGIRLP